MARDEELTNLRWGALVTGAVLAAGVIVFFTGQGKSAFEDTVTVTTDFRTITGLRRGSPVQLAGVRVGEVRAIDFYETSYPCEPAREDVGRHGGGRRDDCDPQLFCAPEGACGMLEPWAEEAQHVSCRRDSDCAEEGTVCVDKPFRRRYPQVFWAGEDGVCAHYETLLQRVRVTMSIQADKLHLLGTDSRAKVASNSVLGDQLVEITRGHAEPLPPGGHIHSLPSTFENMETFRQRLEVVSRKVDTKLASLSGVFGSLNDARTIAKVKDGIAGLQESTADVAEGRGQLGYLFSQEAQGDLDGALRAAEGAADGVDGFVTRANAKLATVQAEMQPKIDDARQSMGQIRVKIEDLHAPDNQDPLARFLYDPEGTHAQEVADDLAKLRALAEDWDAGRGTFGGWLASDDLHDAVLDTLGFTQRADTLRELARAALRAYEAGGGRVAPKPPARPAKTHGGRARNEPGGAPDPKPR